MDHLLVAISQNMDNYYSALSVFSWNMDHLQPIKIVIIKVSTTTKNLQ